MDDAKRCGTCRFFGSERGVYVHDGGESAHHSCVRIIHGNGYPDDPDPEDIDAQHTGDVMTELAVVTDGSGYAARLCVLPTFGCVLHEDKAP